MSEITEAKTALKKNIVTIDEINGLNADSLPKLKEFPSKLLTLIDEFQQEKNENVNTIESNNDEINSLKTKISQNGREISKFEEEIKDLTNKRQELLDKIQEVQKELTNTQEKIRAKKEELENRENRLKELEANVQELKTIQEKFDEQYNTEVEKLNTEFNKKDVYAKSFSNRVKAMKILINKKYISSNILRTIQALQKDVALDIKNIAISLDIREDIIKKFLSKMVEEGGPIEYDESAGIVTLKEEVDF
ncbi:MAG: hypothetical protein GF353_03705 [Candidatus Lokiarchaeota archaeon]|nr:hypothetical protein [Candidatus Lokiarchaeota archaeon]